MKALKCSSLMGVFFLVALFLFNSGVAQAEKQVSLTLTDDDCVKCHAAPPADLMAAGGKHKEVGCTGCHVGHPPTVKKPIPLCSDCHMGKSHFELKGCLNCHKNPHTPLKISFTPNITDACLTCHTQQIEQLRKYKSKHSALDCSKCHDVHRKIPQCTQCHQPHSAAMVAADCKKCHKPHMPAVVTYSADTPSKDCGACHSKVLNLLSANKTKHSALACATCHLEKHKMVPKCQDCHGSPHPAGIMAKFPKCGECHNIAHDLNNWPATTGQEVQKKAVHEKPKGKARTRR